MVLKFNTGNPYSREGQRIAATFVEGGVAMVDYDRHLSYFLKGLETLTYDSVMAMYNFGPKEHLSSMCFDGIRQVLEEEAKTVPPVHW